MADSRSSAGGACGQVHVLGSFIDDALALDAYRELDPDGAFMDPRTAFIVMPFFCGGDLEDLIKKGQKLPERLVLSILAQVIDAVVKLQKHGRAHRDLKPDNVFFAGDQESLALADFGEVGPLRLQFTKGTTSPGGAQEYLAPEIMSRIAGMADGESAELDYSKNDIYAIGMIAYRMCMCDMDASPWPDGGAPSAGALRRIPAGSYSENLRNFVERGLLSPDPAQRMSAVDAQSASTALRFGGDLPPEPVAAEPEPAPQAIAAEPEPQPAPLAVAQPAPQPQPQAAAARMVPRWEWKDDGEQWKAYAEPVAGQLEEAYQSGGRHVDVDADRYVDPKKMIQKRWEDASKWRHVRRLEVPEGVPPQ